MIKQIQLLRWKSFEEASLFIDPITILIGSNAGGKSNALDSLRFLQRLGSGKDLTSALTGESAQPGIRGGTEWAALKPHTNFELIVTIEIEDRTEYVYSIGVDVQSKCELLSESLVRLKYGAQTKKITGRINLYKTDTTSQTDAGIVARLYNETQPTKKLFRNRSLS